VKKEGREAGAGAALAERGGGYLVFVAKLIVVVT